MKNSALFRGKGGIAALFDKIRPAREMGGKKLGSGRKEEAGGQLRSEERRNGGTSAGGREEAGGQ